MKNTKVALELYEPSSQKGKLVKAVLPYGISLSPFTAFFNGSYQDVTLGEKLKKIISRTFGTAFQFSIFWGTPCVDQKITIQIFRGKRILGYCKLGKSERVRTLFFHEDKVLRILQERGIEHVPVSYGVTLVDDGYYAFLQSTEKLLHSKVEHRFSVRQEQFLQILWEKTRKEQLFEKTEFYHSLQTLREKAKYLDIAYQKAVQMIASEFMERNLGKTVKWGVCHGDFTPWNTCLVNGSLFVFDFEYALLHAPSGMDQWHFLIQTLVYEERKCVDEIAAILLECCDDANKKSLIAYLLYVISLYLLRGEESDLAIANQRAELLLKCV